MSSAHPRLVSGQQVRLNPEWYARVNRATDEELMRERMNLKRQEEELMLQEL